VVDIEIKELRKEDMDIGKGRRRRNALKIFFFCTEMSPMIWKKKNMISQPTLPEK
jgi:hypothetical protein